VVIGLLLLITLECLSIARRAKDTAGMLIASGMATLVGFQSFLNISVATGMLPNTGIPLPFVSFGSSSMIAQLRSAGLVQSVWRHRKKPA
jgi:rod shape determining protein RodA